MATMYEFVDTVSCNNCISWSKDHKIALCTDTSVKVLTLVSHIKEADAKVMCHQSSIPVRADVLDIPKYTDHDYQLLMRSLSKYEEMQLIVDKVLNPYRFSQNQVPVTGFAAVAWSPAGAGVSGSCLLATLTQDFRLVIYTQRMSTFKWFEVCDLSLARLEENRPGPEHRTPAKLAAYRNWCYSHAYTALAWWPVLHREMEGTSVWAVLGAGTKSGDIVLWKTLVPTDSRNDCHFYRSFSLHKSQVTSLCWSEWSGSLAVGHVDGQIFVIQINLADPTAESASRCLHPDPDLLRVPCMCFVPDTEGEGEVLLANKEDWVLGFALGANLTVRSQTQQAGCSTLHGTGMCWLGDNTVLLSSLDSVLQLIQFTTQHAELKLTMERLESSLPVPFNKPPMVQGVCISPNQVFLALLQRPSPGYDHLAPMYKTSTKLHIITARSLTASKWAVSAEDIIQRLKDSEDPLHEKLDVLELLRQSMLAASDLSAGSPEVTSIHCRLLKLQRCCLLMKLCRVQSIHDSEIDAETVKDVVGLMTVTLRKSALQILALHIQACVEKIRGTNLDVTSKKNVAVLRNMGKFLEIHGDSLSPVDVGDAAKQLANLISQSDVAMETKCAICSCNLTQALLQLECSNGHVFELCCQTLKPCEGIDYMRCNVCGALSLSPEQLKEYDWLGDTIWTCVLCDGSMSL